MLVQPGQAYKVSADLGGGEGIRATVRVWATQNADGTGWKMLLAQVSRFGQAGDGYTLFHVDGTAGLAAGLNLTGYYIQVMIGGPMEGSQYIAGYYDNIVVTSEDATITTTTYMTPEFHNGGFTAESAGFWYNTPTAIPTGWAEVDRYMYTTGTLWVQCGSTATAINNTGQIVHAGQAFTVSADMGGGEGIDATVRVYATQNADGTGTKRLLASVHRLGQTGDGYTLFHVNGTAGTTATSGVDGYYVQVQIGGPYVDHYIAGYYDNITVTSEVGPVPTAVTYMDADLHNGAMMSESASGGWSDEDLYGGHPYVPYEWSTVDPNADPNRIWQAAVGFPLFDGLVKGVINNTGEKVPEDVQFKIKADLGGFPGATANAYVYATQNADGTGTKVLLAQVSRAGDANGLSPLYMRYPTTGTPGSVTNASVAGYYVQVMLKTVGDPNLEGFYDNIVVTSDAVIAPPDCITVATVGQTVYDMWVSVGKPNCWCYAWQCKGDADGLTEGSAKTGGVYHVGANDLNVLTSGWKKLDTDPAFAANICADFDHQTEGSAKTGGVYHVGANDLNILIANWKSTTVAGNCGGTLVP